MISDRLTTQLLRAIILLARRYCRLDHSSRLSQACGAGLSVTRDVAGSGSLTGAWQHVVRTYDGTTLRGYLNAVNPSGTAMTFDSPVDDGSGAWYLAFGAEDITTYNSTIAGWLSGRVGIMRVYNRALSGAEVTSNYNDAKSIYGL